MLKQVQTC